MKNQPARQTRGSASERVCVCVKEGKKEKIEKEGQEGKRGTQRKQKDGDHKMSNSISFQKVTTNQKPLTVTVFTFESAFGMRSFSCSILDCSLVFQFEPRRATGGSGGGGHLVGVSCLHTGTTWVERRTWLELWLRDCFGCCHRCCGHCSWWYCRSKA